MNSLRKPVDGSPKLTTRDYIRRWFNRFIFHTAKTDQGVRNTLIPRESNDYQPHALRPHWIGIYAAIIILVKIITVGFVSLYADQAQQSDVTATNIIQLTNQARQQFHVGTLRTNALLTKAAQAKATNMVEAHYFAHISPTKVTPWFWFKQAGYAYSYAGENLAIDFIQSEDVIQAWLQSPTHRANLLSNKYKDIGVAVTTGNIDGVQSLIVVQMFGAPIPKPVVRKVTAPAQTPPATVAKAQLAAAPPPPVPTPPKPVVLGETTPVVVVVPPGQPTIVTPETGSVLRTNMPSVIGQAEPGSLVTLVVNDQANGTAVSPADGAYTIVPITALGDGPVQLHVTATARGLTSVPSGTVTANVDTTPPVIQTEQTYALSSLLHPTSLDIWTVTTADAAAVSGLVGSTSTPLLPIGGGRYFGQLATGSNGAISIAAVDPAGNQTQVPVVDPDLLSIGVVAPSSGPGFEALQAIFFSRNFLLTFIVIMLILSALNIVIQIEHQHHPTIIASLLVIYLAGALLFV